MTPIHTSDLPEINAAQQRLFEATAGQGRELPVRFGNDLWKLQCTRTHTPWTPEISIPLRIVDEEAILELSFTPGGNLFNRHAEFRQVASMSEAFALAIRSTLNRELLDALQTALDAGVEISTRPVSIPPKLAFAFDVLDGSGACEARGLLRIGDGICTRIETLAGTWAGFPNPALVNLKHSVALCLGALDLKVSELAGLRAGDCLILGGVSAWPFPLLVSAGGNVISTGIRPVCPTPPLLDFKNQPNMNTQNTVETQNPPEISNLRLPVLVVAGRQEMTLQQLASLRDGASIELGNGEDIPVDIQVNNQVIAAGRLVRVADKICASITEIRDLPKA